MSGKNTKKNLRKRQREELLEALKLRFETNMRTATRASSGSRCKQGWKPGLKHCGRSTRWKEPAANQMS